MPDATEVGMLSRDGILASQLATEELDVPEWGGRVIVRALTGSERDEWDAWRFRQAAIGEFDLHSRRIVRAKMAQLSLVDEDGRHLFSDSDVQALSEKDGAALHRIWEVGLRLSKIVVTDADLRRVADSLKAARSGASGTS